MFAVGGGPGQNPAVTMVRMLSVPHAAPGGLSAAQVRQTARTIADRLPIASAALASYDPSYDRDDRMRDTALDLLGELGRLLPTR